MEALSLRFGRPLLLVSHLLGLSLVSACAEPAYNPAEPADLSATNLLHCVLFDARCRGTDSGSSQTRRRLFEHGTAVSGNLGGIAGADSLCNSSAQRPETGKTYKALISASGVRVACSTSNCGPGNGPAEHLDWVLLPNTEYYQPDGSTLMFTTNSDAIFSSMLAALPGGSAQHWSGTGADWVAANYCFNAGAWLDGTNGVTGVVGSNDVVTTAFFSNGTANCDALSTVLVCVEQ